MKEVRVRFTDTAKDLLEHLKEKRDEHSTDAQLLRSIQQKTEFLKTDPFYGDNVPKKLIPKQYGVQNLWRVELAQFWRMLYTIQGKDNEITCFVIEILDHETYNKRFGYRKK